MEPEGHAGVPLDDRVVQLDAEVDHLLGIAAALPVALAHLRVEQRTVLRPVDLDVGAAQAHQLLHLAPRDVHDVRQERVPGRVSAGRLLGVVVGGRLLRADHGDLARLGGNRAQEDPLLAAHAPPPAQLLDHHRALEDQLLALFVTEGNRPAALPVEAVERLETLNAQD